MKLIWLSDIHLNFLGFDDRIGFYEDLRDKGDAVLITGDIAESHNLKNILKGIKLYTDLPVYFVAGNHDYYGSSIKEMRREMKSWKEVRYLPKRPYYKLTKHVALVGVDGWGDCRNGDVENSHLKMSDWAYIDELRHESKMAMMPPVKTLQKFADKDAERLTKNVRKALKDKNVRKVIIATHVPPFEDVCKYAGKKSTPSGLPFFSSQILGTAILPTVEQHPEIDFLWLCGHTHSAALLEKRPNFVIQVAESQYFNPAIAQIIGI